jgi:hypothetical protein
MDKHFAIFLGTLSVYTLQNFIEKLSLMPDMRKDYDKYKKE